MQKADDTRLQDCNFWIYHTTMFLSIKTILFHTKTVPGCVHVIWAFGLTLRWRAGRIYIVGTIVIAKMIFFFL